ncbi:MAG: type II toxin-antitoxin system VapC family toxin [Candidatus Bathyarchaeia archaeon]
MKKELFYIDSNVFIYPLIYDEEAIKEAGRAKEILLKIASGKIEAYTAAITWDEILWIVRKLFGTELSLEHGRRFLSFPNLKLLGIKKTTILKAQEIVEKYRLTPRDAIHAATALENRIDKIISYDKDFDNLTEIKRVEP